MCVLSKTTSNSCYEVRGERMSIFCMTYCRKCDFVGDLMFSQEGIRHSHISQYFKFHQSLVGRIIHDPFRAIHPEEHDMSIRLLMYYPIV